MKSIISKPEQFDYDEALADLQVLGSESSRIEYKERFETAKFGVARAACSLANALGGIVAIGFKDPSKINGKVELAAAPYDVSQRTASSIVNSILSSTYPSVDCQCYPFKDLKGGRGFYLVRAPQSSLAPHSMTKDNSFPVRRHDGTGYLSLPEIEILIRRRDGIASDLPRLSQAAYLSIQRNTQGDAPNFFGIVVQPESPPRTPRVLDRTENKAVLAMLPSDLKMRDLSMPHGMIICDVDNPTFQNYHTGTKWVHLNAHGAFVMRFNETKDSELWQFARFLGIAYLFASRLWTAWGVGPTATIQLELDLNNTRIADPYMRGELPSYHSDQLRVDLSAGAFPELFTAATVSCIRSSGKPGSAKDEGELLRNVWRDTFYSLDVLSIWDRV